MVLYQSDSASLITVATGRGIPTGCSCGWSQVLVGDLGFHLYQRSYFSVGRRNRPVRNALFAFLTLGIFLSSLAVDALHIFVFQHNWQPA